MGLLELLKLLDRVRRRYLHRLCHRDAATEDAITRFLPPPREHKGMNLEGLGDGLDLDAFQLTGLDPLQLELHAVTTDFPRAGSRHPTPPDVRWKCLLYRGKICRAPVQG